MRKPKPFNGFLRSLHAWLGIVASLNLFVLIGTGFLIQHGERLGLQTKYVGRRWLPAVYRPSDGAEVRTDIVVTDLHSGRLLGETGSLVLDAATLAWLGLLLTGVVIFAVRSGRRQGRSG